METVDLKTHWLRLGEYEDIPVILEYIRTEWNPKHIYVKSRTFFEYEHYIDGRVNGILAINKETGALEGILLFYHTRKILSGADFFGGIWSVSKTCHTPMLGYRLIESVKALTGVRGHNGVGINPNTTAVIFRHIKAQNVGKLNHYYRLADREQYTVAYVKEKVILPIPYQKKEVVLRRLTIMQDLKRNYDLGKHKNDYPYKDEWYIEHRYYKHPIYQYKVWGIEVEGNIEGILVTREAEHDGTKVLRIVDYIGEAPAIGMAGKEIDLLIKENNYEYVDFYAHGLEPEIFREAGFLLRTDTDANIIPNYFEPFVQKNIDLWYHTPYEKVRLFKGDGDQDRPNRLNGQYTRI